MPNPTSKHTRSRRDKRRANWKVSAPAITTCKECSEPTLSHHACPSCGFYRGNKLIRIKEKEKI
ncbi:MAG TPA: 50S ribosomal protein L32 [Thermodesulfovibrionia bacterium]|nr:50S ribosomal protein L32 [Thermodesulfovibrionia bacterium]